MQRFEDLVKLINTTSNPFELSHQMQTMKDGLTDLQNRLRALEAKAKQGTSP